jgi:phosphinothricin acetyltransferase
MQLTKFEIRKATHNDIPQMLGIYNDLILHTTAVYSNEPHTIQMRTEWFETKQQQGFPVYVAAQEDIILGFATFGPFRSWPGYKFTVENSVYVSEQVRGKGIGKLLLAKTIEAAKALNIHVMIAGIDADNAVSIKMHEQFGFVEAAHLKQVGFKFNRWLDLKFLQLILQVQ